MKEINYECPKCGGSVMVTKVHTYPGTTCYRCTEDDCDYHYDETESLTKETRTAPEGDE